jgi:hypothetical protein
VSKAMRLSNEYKKQIDNMSLYPSDRAKMLALPFFMARRKQGPEPKKGQWQWELFNEITGNYWDAFEHHEYDPEDKTTIDSLPKGLVERIDVEDPEFKRQLNMHRLLTKTTIEKHKADQDWYRNFMNYLAHLNEEEGKALWHLLKNEHSDDYLENIHGGHVEEELAKIAEKESYAKRNHQWLRKTRLNYINKEKNPISKAKVKDLFLHSKEFKKKFDSEVGIYDSQHNMIDFEKRASRYFYETAIGPMLKLRDEIGMKRDAVDLSFLRMKDFKELKEAGWDDPIQSHSFQYFLNSLFIPVDVLDYEDEFVGMGEFTDDFVPVVDRNVLNLGRNTKQGIDVMGYKIELDDDTKPNYNRSTAHEDIFADEEDEDDDDEGEGDEGEGDAPTVYKNAHLEESEYPEELYEEPEWPINKHKYLSNAMPKDEYFDYNEKIQERFNDVEIESFMKLLDIKPFRNWQDKTMYHDRIGRHSFNDWGQKSDDEYKMVGEIEREMFEKMVFRKHRSGTTVRFSVGDKRPKFASSDS